MQCVAPPEGLARAGADEAIVGRRIHALLHSKRYERLLTSLHEDPGDLSPVRRRVVEVLWRGYSKTKNQTAAFAYRRSLAFSTAYESWLRAKQASDFSQFRDSFAAVVDYTRQDIDLRDEKPTGYYNACLDDFEKGGSEEKMDAFFAALKRRILPLVKRIAQEGKPIRSDFLTRKCPIPEQEAFSRTLLELEGLRPTALVLMTTEHPFTTNFGPSDVRVTTHYYEDAFLSNVFSTLHEGGHALFMQNEPEEYYADHVADEMTSAMHETVSRFFENYIGRSAAFVHYLYPIVQKVGGKTFSDVSEEELYLAVNSSKPGLNRCDSDELTYPIHVMIRYELEKAFVNGDLAIKGIPAAWNERYKAYLGVDVPNDAEGCLQDVHWTGMYGYFPSYALGNAYGAQILHTMEKEFDVFDAVSKGDLSKVGSWLTERVFSIASLTDPDEWIKRITGEPLNVNYYLDYLENKFKTIYQLS